MLARLIAAALLLVGAVGAAAAFPPFVPSPPSTPNEQQAVVSIVRPSGGGSPTDTNCYANCDSSTTPPCLSPNDFACFITATAMCDPYANCDGVGGPCATANDFLCFFMAYVNECGVAGSKNCFPP